MIGLLLINLGTPEAPETEPVRTYLRQFLNDDRVLDMNPAARAALLNLVILRKRPKESAAAYKQIWTERGSPLLVESQDLREKVATRLGDSWLTELGMRYGNPSIKSALTKLVSRGADQIVVFPLYPQYAASSTGTALEEVYRLCAEEWNVVPVSVVAPFYNDDGFLDAFASNGRKVIREENPDHVLFSYHGLPERHVQKSDPSSSHCLATESCCDSIGETNKHCYRAQCYATTRALAQRLELSDETHSVSFQSRLGKTPWIQPFTDEALPGLADQGVKRLVVICPSFVADCLETLEEIQIRADQQFREAGGEKLTLIPSLNSGDEWVEAVCALARRAAPK